MQQSINPYRVGGPVPVGDFVGRELVVESLCGRILTMQHSAIYGENGTGKSSILGYVASPEAWEKLGWGERRKNIVIAPFNCGALRPFSLARFWGELVTTLRDHQDLKGDQALQTTISGALAKAEVSSEDFRNVLGGIKNRNQVLALLLDDYDAVLETHSEHTEQDSLDHLSGFRNLAVHNPQGSILCVTVATRRPLKEIGPPAEGGSPWDNHYLYEPLGHFTEEEAVELVEKMPPGSLSPASERFLREVSGGHPLLLQTACWLMFNALRSGQSPNSDQLSLELVRRSGQVFQRLWNNTSRVGQMLLMLIALRQLDGRLQSGGKYDVGDVHRIFSQRNRDLIDLGDRGIIRGDFSLSGAARTRNYSFFSPIMEWWVVTEIENSTEEALARREKIFLDLLSRDQAERIQGVLRAVWREKKAITSIASWVVALI